jgi:hypothetical protein
MSKVEHQTDVKFLDKCSQISINKLINFTKLGVILLFFTISTGTLEGGSSLDGDTFGKVEPS